MLKKKKSKKTKAQHNILQNNTVSVYYTNENTKSAQKIEKCKKFEEITFFFSIGSRLTHNAAIATGF